MGHCNLQDGKSWYILKYNTQLHWFEYKKIIPTCVHKALDLDIGPDSKRVGLWFLDLFPNSIHHILHRVVSIYNDTRFSTFEYMVHIHQGDKDADIDEYILRVLDSYIPIHICSNSIQHPNR